MGSIVEQNNHPDNSMQLPLTKTKICANLRDLWIKDCNYTGVCQSLGVASVEPVEAKAVRATRLRLRQVVLELAERLRLRLRV